MVLSFFYVRRKTQLTVTIKKLFPLITFFFFAVHSWEKSCGFECGRCELGEGPKRTQERASQKCWKFAPHEMTLLRLASPPEAIFSNEQNLSHFPFYFLFFRRTWMVGNLWRLEASSLSAVFLLGMKNCVTTFTLPLSMIYNRITFNLRFVAAVVQFLYSRESLDSTCVRADPRFA